MQGSTATPLCIADMQALTAQMNAGTLPRDPKSLAELQGRIAAAHGLQQHGQETLQTADTWLNKKHPRNVLMAAVVFATLAYFTEGASKKLNQGMVVFAITALASIYFLKHLMTKHDAVLAHDLRDHAAALTAFENTLIRYNTLPTRVFEASTASAGAAPENRG